MLDRRPQLGSQTGQTAAEAMGVLLLVSLIIAALVISGVGQAITDRTAELICKIAGSSCDDERSSRLTLTTRSLGTISASERRSTR